MKRRSGTAAQTIVMMMAGAFVALLPATAQAAAARLFDLHAQAALSISLAIGAFVSVIVTAWSLESRLAEPDVQRPTFIPLWSAVAGVSAGIALALTPGSIVTLCIAMPILQTALFVGRTHSISVSDWKTEAATAVLLLLGCGTTFALSIMGATLSLVPFALLAGIAILVRALNAPLRPLGPIRIRSALWVSGETAVVALTPLALNVAILVLIGPSEAVAFRLIITVLGVLQPILGYTRIRLLTTHSAALVAATYALTAGALLTLLLCAQFGVFHMIFGESWAQVSMLALAFACAWKFLTVAETIPFATMRRSGHVKLVFASRAASTALFIGFGVLAAFSFRTTAAVMAGFVIAQLCTDAIYMTTARHAARHYGP